MLTRYDYKVITASAGREALVILRLQPDLKIDIALIDVVMQDMPGTDVARELSFIRPGLPVLLMTGFPDQHQILVSQGLHVLSKPFTSVTLVRRIRDILDRPKATAAAR